MQAVTHSFGDCGDLPYPTRPHPMAGAPRWAIELYLQNLELERLMSELQDTLNEIASELSDALRSINLELTQVEQQLAAGATPDLSALRAAVDQANNTKSRITAVADGQPDPAGQPGPADGAVVDPTAPATVDSGAEPAPVDPGVQPETIDTAAQTPDSSGI